MYSSCNVTISSHPSRLLPSAPSSCSAVAKQTNHFSPRGGGGNSLALEIARDGDSDIQDATLSEKETLDLYDYLVGVRDDLDRWETGPLTGEGLSLEESVFAFEAIANLSMGDPEPRNRAREEHVDSFTVAMGLGATPTSTRTAAQTLEMWQSLKALLQNQLGRSELSSPQVLFVDIAYDVTSLASNSVFVKTMLGETSRDQFYQQLIADPITDTLQWGPDSLFIKANDTNPCPTDLTADDAIEGRLNFKLFTTNRLFNVVTATVRDNPKGRNGSRFPVVLDTTLYDFPTGSSDKAIRGEFFVHSDYGRGNELCFAPVKTENYVSDGFTLATVTLAPRIPLGKFDKRDNSLLRRRAAFANNAAAKIGPIEVDTDIFGTERIITGNYFYAQFPALITLPPELTAEIF